MMARKRRTLNPDKHFPTELPEVAGREAGGGSPASVCEPHPPAEPRVLAVEGSAPTNEEVPLVLVVKPQALAWAQHIARFLQIGELPEEHEEAEKVALRSCMYQFVDDTL
jgi:hypothetical protein